MGLEINRQAAETRPGQDHVKRVIAEMGGKNAIIVDDDADLDEAVVGVLQSAFGYAGQKCSALLAGRSCWTASTTPSSPGSRGRPSSCRSARDDPETLVGPVIDAEARKRVPRYQAAGGAGRDACSCSDRRARDGLVRRPDDRRRAARAAPRIAQEEIFGPVLAVIKARDLDHALAIANDSDYALTGGCYSRTRPPRARQREFASATSTSTAASPAPSSIASPSAASSSPASAPRPAAPTTSSSSSPRAITENTMRRGFAPE